MNIRKYILLILAIFSLESLFANGDKIEIVKADKKAATSFAIFVDSQTYQECKDEITAYRQVLQEEGLGTYILSAQWKNPDQVKSEIVKLAKMKPRLEGMVFIGDIPIVRVRKGQFLTTAFKMNESSFPIEESSVTSDRFYEDLKLKFEFMCRDSVNANHFYYNLTSEGEINLDPEFYSARMLVPENFPGDKYEVMREYLRKVVDAHREENSLDNFIYFAGSAYNSDCMTVWRQQQIAFREYFPNAFYKGSTNKFFNFRQDPYMKFKLYNEVQRKSVDLFMFTEHGSVNKQHINGPYPAKNYSESIEELKREVRSAYKRYRGTEKEDDFKQEVMKAYGLNPSVFSDEEIEKYRLEDSSARANINILPDDIAKLKSGPRWIIFNACYNGSFHQPDYIAGYHIFNGGRTIVTQGNTVNVLQDKWAEQLIGYLALGVRAGLWQKEVLTLESHIIGDPTFRFNPDRNFGNGSGKGSQNVSGSDSGKGRSNVSGSDSGKGNSNVSGSDSGKGSQNVSGSNSGKGNSNISKSKSDELNNKLVTGRDDTGYWNSLLTDNDPRLRATAIKQLSKYYRGNSSESALNTFSADLLKIFAEDKSWTVRMQALNELSFIGGENFTKAVNKGLTDQYELIMRKSATWAGDIGDPVLIPNLVKIILFHPEVQRLQYAAPSALGMFEADAVINEYVKQKENSHLKGTTPDVEKDPFMLSFSRTMGWIEGYLNSISDKEAKFSQREGAIRYLRNNQIHRAIDLFDRVLNDPTENEEVRILMAEALGWFEYSYRKDEVVQALQRCIGSASISKQLREEAQKSLKRMK